LKCQVVNFVIVYRVYAVVGNIQIIHVNHVVTHHVFVEEKIM